MDLSPCHKTFGFSDIYDSDGDSRNWYFGDISKNDCFVQERCSKIQDKGSSDTKSSKYSCVLERQGNGIMDGISAITKEESNCSVFSKESNLGSANKAMDGDRFWDFLKQADGQRHAQILGLKNLAESKTRAESPMDCKESVWSKCTESSVEPPDSEENVFEKHVDNFWDFLKCVEQPRTFNTKCIKTCNAKSSSEMGNEVSCSKATKAFEEASCFETKPFENIEHNFKNVLISTEESVDSKTSNVNASSIEQFQVNLNNFKRIGMQAVASKEADPRNKLLGTTKNTENDDTFWDFLETACETEAESILELKQKLDFSKTRPPHVASEKTKSDKTSVSIASDDTNDDPFWDFLKSDRSVEKKTICIAPEPPHATDSSALSSMKKASDQNGSKTLPATLKCDELNIRRKRNVKTGKKLKKDLLLGNESTRVWENQNFASCGMNANNALTHNSSQTQPKNQKASSPESHNENIYETNRPIITSIFSIPSCPGLFDQRVHSPTESSSAITTNPLSHGCFEDRGVEEKGSCTKILESTPMHIQDSSPHSSEAREQVTKRPRPETNSPRNSVFKITDYEDPMITDTGFPALSFTDAKRMKISVPNDDPQEVPKTQSTFAAPAFVSRAPQMTPVYQEVAYAQSHPSIPQYIILPNSVQAGQQQNTEHLVLIQIDPSDPTKAVFRIPINDAKLNLPVLQYPGEVRSQLIKPEEQLASLPPTAVTIGLMPAVQAVNMQSFYAPTVIYQPTRQCSESVQSKVQSLTSTNMLFNAGRHSQDQGRYVTSAAASVVNAKPFSAKVNLPVITVPVNLSSIKQCPGADGTSNDVEMSADGVKSFQPFTMEASHKGRNKKPTAIKPIKTISIGKDKNAIQQTSYPVTIESVSGPQVILGNPSIPLGNNIVLPPINAISHQEGKEIRNSPVSPEPSKTPNVLKVVHYIPNVNALSVEKNIIPNANRLVKKDIFLKPKQSSIQSGERLPINTAISKPIIVPNSEPKRPTYLPACTGTEFTVPINSVPSAQEARSLQFEICPSSEIPITQNLTTPVVTVSSTNSLDALKKLFPPPISMIPVCLVQSLPNANKPTTSRILVIPAPTLTTQSGTKQASANSRTVLSSKPVTKQKKEGRKTVRELLQEKYGHLPESKVNDLRTGSLWPRPTLNSNQSSLLGNLSASNEQSTFQHSTQVMRTPFNLIKRPNIMLLPSAATLNPLNTRLSERFDQNRVKKSQHEELTSFLEQSSTDFLTDNSLVCSSDEKRAPVRECRPRHYDMCELSIGYLKVEDFVDSHGHFQSKFKAFFTKRKFIYDFPVSKSNQVDFGQAQEPDSFVRIMVPFDIIEGMSAFNRRIELKVQSSPEIYLWKIHNAKLDPASDVSKGFSKPSNNSMWLDIINNSLIHKITLRKRQADNLKAQLCEVDPEMVSLFDAGLSLGLSIIDATPYEEEILSARLRKVTKSRRTTVRRLPQWDADSPDQKGLLPSNHACSCRISCRSLRCSCVKAARACGTGGATCSCSDCDNPLNILQSYGLDVELSLRDRCLFQNIYRIASLRNFLQRAVKMSCCNSVARVVDCIPSTTLCPNMDCNACLEFSWCRGIVCYPERNPRKHCSHCGQCCFSNGRHCSVCNRCYTVTLKHPECPGCKGMDDSLNLACNDKAFDDNFCLSLLSSLEEKHATCSVSKPEIILLDNSTDIRRKASLNIIQDEETERGPNLPPDEDSLPETVKNDCQQTPLRVPMKGLEKKSPRSGAFFSSGNQSVYEGLMDLKDNEDEESMELSREGTNSLLESTVQDLNVSIAGPSVPPNNFSEDTRYAAFSPSSLVPTLIKSEETERVPNLPPEEGSLPETVKNECQQTPLRVPLKEESDLPTTSHPNFSSQESVKTTIKEELKFTFRTVTP